MRPVTEHHDCAMPDCAAWGTQQFTGHVPGYGMVTGYVCPAHTLADAQHFSIDRTDGRLDTPGNEPLAWPEGIPIPKTEETFVPINRAARRAAARGRK